MFPQASKGKVETLEVFGLSTREGCVAESRFIGLCITVIIAIHSIAQSFMHEARTDTWPDTKFINS